MPYLTSGAQSLNLSVPAGSSLVIRNLDGVETVMGSTVAREDASSTLGSGAYVYGPQTSTSLLTISTSGNLSYEVVAGDPTPANKTLKYGPDNTLSPDSLAALAGSGVGTSIYRRQVASRCGAVDDVVPNIQQFQSRSRHQIFNPVSNLVVQFSNEKLKSNNLIPSYGSAVTIKAALEYNGVVYPLTFNGKRVGTIADGGYIDTDQLNINIPPNATVFIRQLVTLVTTAGNPGMLLFKKNNRVLNTSATDLDSCEVTTNLAGSPLTDKVDSGTISNSNTIASNATPTSNAASAIAWPAAITTLMAGDNHANLFLGDSISIGANDYPDKVGSGAGILERTIGKRAPWINVSAFGLASWTYAGQNNDYLQGSRPAGIVAARLAAYCGRVICAMGHNQLNTNSPAQVFGDHKVMMENLDYINGRPLDYVFTTILPRTTSTDSWATTANQTVNYSSLANYQTYNNYVRAGTFGGYTGRSWVGYIDFAGAVESSADSCIWKAPGYTADGIHPTVTGYAALEAGAQIRIPNSL